MLFRSWGSTYGPIKAAVAALRSEGIEIAQAHIKYLNPFPKNLGDILAKYEKVIIPEMNLGQLAMLIKAKYLKDVVSYTMVKGLPFTTQELIDAAKGALDV